MMNYGKVDATADEMKNAGEPLLAANRVEVIVTQGNEYTPTLIVSHAFLTYKRRHKTGFEEGNIITPSDCPHRDGGFKHHPSKGGTEEKGFVDG